MKNTYLTLQCTCSEFHVVMYYARHCLIVKANNIYFGQMLQIEIEVLKLHMDKIASLLMLPGFAGKHASGLKNATDALLSTMKKYHDFLSLQQQRSATNHASPEPVRSLQDNWVTEIREGFPDTQLLEEYKALKNKLDGLGLYEPISLLYFQPSDSYESKLWYKSIKLPFPIGLYIYRHGNYLGNLTFAWKIPVSVDDRTDEDKINVLSRVREMIPTYSTRAMRKNFIMRYAKVTKIKPAILRDMYIYLTGDSASGESVEQNAIQKRVAEFFLTADDEQLIYDLRANNGRPSDSKLDPFWAELGKYLEEKCAVQERRHNEQLYMPFAVSIRDLIDLVKERLPQGTAVPSVSWVALNFYPSNPHTRTAVNYTGRFQVKRVVQQRLLRAQHEDSSYAAHQFNLMKHMAVKYREYSCFICVDDKAVVPIGEPNRAVSTGVRAHNRSLVCSTQNVVALDHDFHIFGIVPSVLFHVEIPEVVEDGFYSGEVHVTLKDKVQQPSSPFRHAVENVKILQKLGEPVEEEMETELQNRSQNFDKNEAQREGNSEQTNVEVPTLQVLDSVDRDAPHSSVQKNGTEEMSSNVAIQEATLPNQEQDKVLDDVQNPSSSIIHKDADHLFSPELDKPILFLYSDGGPDHRTNFGSVQIASIALFVALNLDMYIAVRTAPNQSYANPAERIMSLLNIALQNVALARTEMSDILESRVKSLSNMKQIRNAINKNDKLKEELSKSVQPAVQILFERFSRLKWKDQQVQVHQAASSQQTEDFLKVFDAIDEPADKLHVHPTFQQNPGLKNFLQTHCRVRHYMFQVYI